MILQWVNNINERKTVEISVPSVDGLDSVFPHENRHAGVEDQVASYVRYLGKYFGGNLRVAFGCREYGQVWRGQQRFQK